MLRVLWNLLEFDKWASGAARAVGAAGERNRNVGSCVTPSSLNPEEFSAAMRLEVALVVDVFWQVRLSRHLPAARSVASTLRLRNHPFSVFVRFFPQASALTPQTQSSLLTNQSPNGHGEFLRRWDGTWEWNACVNRLKMRLDYEMLHGCIMPNA